MTEVFPTDVSWVDDWIDYAWLNMTGDQYAAYQLTESIPVSERSTFNVEA